MVAEYVGLSGVSVSVTSGRPTLIGKPMSVPGYRQLKCLGQIFEGVHPLGGIPVTRVHARAPRRRN